MKTSNQDRPLTVAEARDVLRDATKAIRELRTLMKSLKKRTASPEAARQQAPFYRRTRVEELGAKHPGLLRFVKKEMKNLTPYPRIAAAIQERWGERVATQVLSNFYIKRVWPKMLDAGNRKEA